MNNMPNNMNTGGNAPNSSPKVPPAFGDSSSRRTMDSNGQQIPPPYQQVPPQYQQVPPQYQQVPPQYQQMPPQYQQMPPQYQQMPPQYQQMPPQYQQMPPQYQYPQPPIYYYPVVSHEQLNKQVFKTHCSRVGLTAMADVGLMILVQFAVIYLGILAYFILFNSGRFKWLTPNEAIINITMFAMGLSAIVGNLVPAAAHGHKWKIKFTDPFKGDKLNIGFIAAATATALGLNFIWNFIYNIVDSLFNNFVGIESTSVAYTPEVYSPVAMIMMVVWSCVIAPVTEEYMFRGILLRTLSKYGATFGIVTSAFMFGLMHGNMAQTPMAFLLGLVMGYVTIKSGNIRQSIFIHMFNNIFATIPSIVYYCNPDMMDAVNDIYMIIELSCMVFAVGALIYTAVTFNKGKKARQWRLQTGSAVVADAETRLAKIEIPQEKLMPEIAPVNHKVRNLLSSGGMIFFICYSVLSILISLLPAFILLVLQLLARLFSVY